MTNTLNFPGSDRHAPTARHAPALPGPYRGDLFRGTGRGHRVFDYERLVYHGLTTPRSLPYLIVGAILLFALSVAAWLGVFHADERSSFRFLVALVIPMLLIAVPFQPGNGTGFDTYAAGRAIAIRRGRAQAGGIRSSPRARRGAQDHHHQRRRIRFVVLPHRPQSAAIHRLSGASHRFRLQAVHARRP